MASNVTVIPPRAVRPDVLHVAAYCRVSSDSADQLHSYAAQIRYYTDLMQNHDGWDLVDVYADEGITGTRMDKREDFNRLLADCRKGKIDKVLVKSISRLPATPVIAWPLSGSCSAWAYPSSLKKKTLIPERSPPN